MYMTYKARIYPNAEQRKLISKTFGCSRFVWNHMLDRVNKMYNRRGESFSRFDMNYVLTDLKRIYPWLSEVDSTALTAVVDNLNNSRQAFFKHKAGRPKFKSKRKPCKSYTTKSGAIKYCDRHITLPKLGTMLMHNKRFPTDGCKIKRATVSINTVGEYYVSLLVEEEVLPLPEKDTSVGIDMGIDCFYTDSNGNKIDNPKFFEQAKAKLAEEQRKLAKKEYGSHNYNKQKKRVAKCQLKIKRQREHFHNCMAKQLTDENQVICVETLNVKNMLAPDKKLTRKVKRNYNKAIADTGISAFIRKLEQKSEMTGREFVKIPEYYPSSQTCNCCGYINPLVKDLFVRQWVCPKCGVSHDRDINAAINILNEGLRTA